MRPLLPAVAAAAVVAFLPSLAFAHTGVGDVHGFSHGFMHPVTGLDHVLAMVAVGIFAGQLGGRALWAVPLTFVTLMVIGGALGMAGIDLPFVEIVIALSVVVLGAAIALGLNVPLTLAMALVGAFAVFHGHAHGAEMPDDASGLAYGVGFVTGTALLHLAGLGIGIGIGRIGARGGALVRGTGAAIALAGVAILTGIV